MAVIFLTKLSILNNYLNYYDLRSVSLKQSLDNLSVNNLVCNLQCNVIAKLPLVSILVPAYNVDKLIKSCINSLLKQDYKNIEILVIDDASTDETANVIRDLEAQYSQVKGIYLRENVGPFVAKNIAALHSSGEFITTQDADDWAHPERISRQVQPLLQDSNLVATTCQWLRLDENGNFYAKQHFPFKRFNPSSPMFRKRDVTKKMGLWDSVRMAADTEFIERMRLVYGKSRIRYLKQPLVIGAHRQNSLMTSIVTGNLENRISPIRLSYWEAWRNWHIQQISLGKKPYMPFGCNYTPQFKIPNLMQNDSLKLSIIYNDMLIN